LYFTTSEALGDSFCLGDFDAHVAEIFHLLPISHRILLNFIRIKLLTALGGYYLSKQIRCTPKLFLTYSSLVINHVMSSDKNAETNLWGVGNQMG
jgi:hypothetical protein